jgi:hypothetical protein
VKVTRGTLAPQPGGEYRDCARQARTLKFGGIEGPTGRTRLTGDGVPCSHAGGKKPEVTLVNGEPLSELNCGQNALSEFQAEAVFNIGTFSISCSVLKRKLSHKSDQGFPFDVLLILKNPDHHFNHQ